MEIFCINSVKGGSGKTTMSLTILYNRAISYMTAYKHGKQLNGKKRFAYIDLDLQGTGVSRLIYGENERKKVKFYNDFDQSIESYLDYKNIFPENEADGVVLDAYLLNDSDDAKTLYGVKQSEMLEKRNISRFKEKAIGIIDQIIESKEYDTIVLDNAPSYDYISSDIFKHICQQYNREENRIVNAFVTTLEKSQIYTTISKVSNILKKTEYNIGVYIICNDVHQHFDQGDIDGQAKFKQKIYEIIERPSSMTLGIKECPLTISGDQEGFSLEKIIVMERLDICRLLVFGNEETYNQVGILSKLICNKLIDDLRLDRGIGSVT